MEINTSVIYDQPIGQLMSMEVFAVKNNDAVVEWYILQSQTNSGYLQKPTRYYVKRNESHKRIHLIVIR